MGFLLLSLAVAPAFGVEIGGKYYGPNDVLPVIESADSGSPIQPDEFGTAGISVLNLGPCDLRARSAADFAKVNNFNPLCESIGVLSGQDRVFIGAEVHLPNGVQITEITMHYTDTKPDTNPSAGFHAASTTGVGTEVQIFDQALAGAFSGGNRSVSVTLLTPHTVDNTTNTYHFNAILHRSIVTPTQEERIYRVAIKYRRQVSPAPLVLAGKFSDVPTTHPFFRFVEALAASGITGGCGATAYCPDLPVTRGQMALFLSTALGLHWPN